MQYVLLHEMLINKCENGDMANLIKSNFLKAKRFLYNFSFFTLFDRSVQEQRLWIHQVSISCYKQCDQKRLKNILHKL